MGVRRKRAVSRKWYQDYDEDDDDFEEEERERSERSERAWDEDEEGREREDDEDSITESERARIPMVPLWVAIRNALAITFGYKPAREVYVKSDPDLELWLDHFKNPLKAKYIVETMRTELTTYIVARLKALPYEVFLRTPYWTIVRAYVMTMRGARCEQCSWIGALNVHHMTYSHRGEELFHLEDLKVLCEFCHMRTHEL
jgi:hypothetical protein